MKNSSPHPLGWVPTVYFAMGLPFVVLNMVAAVMFKNLDIPNAEIAFWTSLIMWPWTIKFLWSPFLEIFRTKKFFVVATQIVSGLFFGIAAIALHIPDCFAIMIALFAVIAFSGATHDIAADGVYMSELTQRDQSRYIGWQGAFYNLAKLVATGGLVGLAGILARSFGGTDTPAREHFVDAWMIVLAIIGGVLLLLGAWHTRIVPSTAPPAAKGATFSEGMSKLRGVIAAFFTKRYIWLYIAFIILYRLGEGFVMKIVPLFLMSSRDSGGLALSNEQIGLYYGTCGAAAFLLGSLLAGYYTAHRPPRTAPLAVHALLRVQHPLRRLRHTRMAAAREHGCGRRSDNRGVFRLRIRVRGAHTIHDAAGGARTAPDGSLRLRIRHHELLGDAHRSRERLHQRRPRLRTLLHRRAARHHTRVRDHLVHTVHTSRRFG